MTEHASGNYLSRHDCDVDTCIYTSKVQFLYKY